jgi:hypothetical protein
MCLVKQGRTTIGKYKSLRLLSTITCNGSSFPISRQQIIGSIWERYGTGGLGPYGRCNSVKTYVSNDCRGPLCVQWLEVRDACTFGWYWWKCFLSLFRIPVRCNFFPILICFHMFVIVRNRVSKIRENVCSVWKDHTFISACC